MSLGKPILFNSGDIYIGQKRIFERSLPTQLFRGEISDLNIWNRVLLSPSIRRISSNCGCGRGTFRAWTDFRKDSGSNAQGIKNSLCKYNYYFLKKLKWTLFMLEIPNIIFPRNVTLSLFIWEIPLYAVKVSLFFAVQTVISILALENLKVRLKPDWDWQPSKCLSLKFPLQSEVTWTENHSKSYLKLKKELSDC